MTALLPTAAVIPTMRPSAVGRIRSQAEALGLGQVRVLKGGGRRRGAAEDLLKDLLSGGVATVVIESLARLHPIPARALGLLAAMRSAGLRVVCLTDGWAGTADVETLKSVASYLEAAEHKKNSRAGRRAIAVARAGGRKLGRPRKEWDRVRAAALVAELGSYRKAATALGIGCTTLRRG